MTADTASGTGHAGTRVPPFLRAIEGSSGTLVLGHGIDALTGDVMSVSADHVTLEVPDARATDGYRVHVVPVHAIAYWRFADDD